MRVFKNTTALCITAAESLANRFRRLRVKT
jgi:hypothetical protein